MDFGKLFGVNMHDVFRNEIVSHSIRILRERGQSNAEIKAELLRDFSIKTEILDEMLKKEK